MASDRLAIAHRVHRPGADVKRLRTLEAENTKLKRMLAEREMAIDTLKEINRRKW
jgi:putative transposase